MAFYKKLLIIFLLLQLVSLVAVAAVKIDDSKLKIFSVVDIVKHNNKKSCWVVMDKYIYDVTRFLPDHPGAFKILSKCCGKDCTKGYADKGIDEPHSKKSHKMRAKMLIGILKEKM